MSSKVSPACPQRTEALGIFSSIGSFLNESWSPVPTNNHFINTSPCQSVQSVSLSPPHTSPSSCPSSVKTNTPRGPLCPHVAAELRLFVPPSVSVTLLPPLLLLILCLPVFVSSLSVSVHLCLSPSCSVQIIKLTTCLQTTSFEIFYRCFQTKIGHKMNGVWWRERQTGEDGWMCRCMDWMIDGWIDWLMDGQKGGLREQPGRAGPRGHGGIDEGIICISRRSEFV